MNDDKYTIVLYVRDLGQTGGGNIVVNVSNSLSQSGHEIIWVTDTTSSVKYSENIQVIEVPFGRSLFNWKTSNKLTLTVRHFLQILNFNIFTLYFYFKFKKDNVIQVNNNNEVIFGHIITIHNVFSAEVFKHPQGRLRGFLRLLNPVTCFRVFKENFILRFRKNAYIIANSEQTKIELNNFLNLNRNVSVVPSGVDLDKFTQCKRTMSVESNFELLFVGHEFERKGLKDIIQSLALLPLRVRLHVVGGRGSNEQYYRDLVVKMGLEGRVFFHGSQSNLKQFYQRSHLFLLPSVYEGLPLVCLESMACGLPNLLTKVGGMKNLIEEGVNGYFVEKNPNSIADKILLILKMDESAYLKLSDLTRNSVLSYSWQNIAEEHELIFESSMRKIEVKNNA